MARQHNWQDMSVTSDAFTNALKDVDTALQFMHEYFTIHTVPNGHFLRELASHYPDLLLKAIRYNRAFLESSPHTVSLRFLEEEKDDLWQRHTRVFNTLGRQENELYRAFETQLACCRSYPLMDTLAALSLWYERARLQLIAGRGGAPFEYDHSGLLECMNYFLSHYLYKVNVAEAKQWEAAEDVKVMGKLLDHECTAIEVVVNKVMQAVEQYLSFLHGPLDTYCFDMNYDAEVQNGNLVLCYTNSKALYQWQKEQEKLRYWHSYYRALGQGMVEAQIQQSPDFIKNTKTEDEWMKWEGTVRYYQACFIAEDYGLLDSRLGDILVNELLLVLKGFTNSAFGRFVQPVDNLNHKHPERWRTNIVNVMAHFRQKQIKTGPLRISDEHEFFETIAKEHRHYDEARLQACASLLSYNTEAAPEPERYVPVINLSAKPFIKFGDWYVGFNALMGESSAQVSVLENCMYGNRDLHIRVMGQEVEKLEASLSDQFRRAGFVNVLSSVDYYRSKKERVGNFDVAVYANGVLLLIELKRSRVRNNLPEAHDEYMNTLSKAGKQLDKAVAYIQEKWERCKSEYFSTFPLEGKVFSEVKVYTLIVATSFEHDHELIGGRHLKITLFELQQVLTHSWDRISTNQLENLILHVCHNRYWQALEDRVKVPETKGYDYNVG